MLRAGSRDDPGACSPLCTARPFHPPFVRLKKGGRFCESDTTPPRRSQPGSRLAAAAVTATAGGQYNTRWSGQLLGCLHRRPCRPLLAARRLSHTRRRDRSTSASIPFVESFLNGQGPTLRAPALALRAGATRAGATARAITSSSRPLSSRLPTHCNFVSSSQRSSKRTLYSPRRDVVTKKHDVPLHVDLSTARGT